MPFLQTTHQRIARSKDVFGYDAQATSFPPDKRIILEAQMGFAPMNNGFADHRVSYFATAPHTNCYRQTTAWKAACTHIRNAHLLFRALGWLILGSR